jgi:hypothetical protein
LRHRLLKEVGGGLQLSTSGAFGLNKDALERTDLIEKALGRPARTVNMVELGTALNTLGDPPVKARLQLESRCGLSESQPGDSRPASSGLVHRGA